MSGSLLNFDLKGLRLPAWLRPGDGATRAGGLRPKYPTVAVDMGVRHVSVVRLAKDKLRKWVLTSVGQVDVPEDLLESDVFSIRITSEERYRQLVAGALQTQGIRTDRISLVVPDHLARVALLPFEQLPRTRREVTELVRWKMKKAVPFKIEEAVVDYEVFPGEHGLGFSVLAVIMPSAIVTEHESVFVRQGIRPGLMDLSTFSLLHLYRSVMEAEVPAGGDFLVVNATGFFFTLMIFRKGLPIFYRCKTFTFGGEQEGDAALRLIHRESQASLVYYQERLQGRELSRIYMRLVGHDFERVAGLFEGAPSAQPPELIDPRRVVRVPAQVEAGGPARAIETLQRLAPAVGAALGREA
ncbi:MAG: type IV pilus biogenesis protein PilM [Candidatus Polarisedimenticolia bacterium]